MRRKDENTRPRQNFIGDAETYDGISDHQFFGWLPPFRSRISATETGLRRSTIEALTPYQTEQVALTLLRGKSPFDLRLPDRRLVRLQLLRSIRMAAFRVNIFRQQGHFSIVLRKLQAKVPPSIRSC